MGFRTVRRGGPSTIAWQSSRPPVHSVLDERSGGHHPSQVVTQCTRAVPFLGAYFLEVVGRFDEKRLHQLLVFGVLEAGVSSRGITVFHEGTVPPKSSPGHPVSSWVKDGSMGSISRSQSCESLPWVVHPPHSDSAFPRASPQFGRSNAAWSEPTFALLGLVVLSAAALGHAMFPPCRSVRPPSTVSFLSFVRSFCRPKGRARRLFEGSPSSTCTLIIGSVAVLRNGCTSFVNV